MSYLMATAEIEKSLARQRVSVAIEHLLGMVQGMLADGLLHDLEIKLLATWLDANAETVTHWPASVVAVRVRNALADGLISEDERQHLLQTLADLLANDFAQTGSASPEPTRLPVDDAVPVDVRDAGFCLTGEFAYGTRSACEKLTTKAGGVTVGNVSKKSKYVVIGSRVSPQWAHTSYGRKIERAIELQQEGHCVCIISEQRWLQALGD
jgi:NAD-dependent DNA ligase